MAMRLVQMMNIDSDDDDDDDDWYNYDLDHDNDELFIKAYIIKLHHT